MPFPSYNTLPHYSILTPTKHSTSQGGCIGCALFFLAHISSLLRTITPISNWTSHGGVYRLCPFLPKTHVFLCTNTYYILNLTGGSVSAAPWMLEWGRLACPVHSHTPRAGAFVTYMLYTNIYIHMCMNIYIYIHIYMQTYTYMYVYMWYMYMHIYIHI